jgi:hypothetical protein
MSWNVFVRWGLMLVIGILMSVVHAFGVRLIIEGEHSLGGSITLLAGSALGGILATVFR